MEEKNIYINNLQKVIHTQKEIIENLKGIINIQQKQIDIYEKYIDKNDQEQKKKKQILINTQWVAIYEFITLFLGTKGEIYDNKYLQSAFSLANIPLTEKNVINMFEYAVNHFEHDIKCMEN